MIPFDPFISFSQRYARKKHMEMEAIRLRQEEIYSSPIAREAYKGKVIEHEPSANGASRRD